MAPNRADLRVMVDANILIAGSLWPRWPYEVLQHALAGDFQLVLSPYVIAQARRFLEKDFPEQAGQLDDLLEAAQCEMAPDPTREQVAARANLVRDASDVPVALAAIQSKVDFLVSEDKDLTVRDASTEALRRELTVLISGTFLREVMGWPSEALEMIRKRSWQDL